MSANGVSMMFKAFGIDPQAIVDQFQQQIQGFQDVVVVFDKRLSAVEEMVSDMHRILVQLEEKNRDEENRTNRRLTIVAGE